MWSTATYREDERGSSTIACHSCRRRKVKCDRQLPRCHVCIQTDQTCKYPLRSLKPGPKIGSIQRSRKRTQAHASQKEDEQQDSSAGSPQDQWLDFEASKERVAVYGGCNRARSQSSKKAPCDRGKERSQADRDCEWKHSHFNMHDLSFVLHPSHEVSTPEKEQEHPQNDEIDQRRHTLLQRASQDLQLSQPMLDLLIRIYFDNMVAINIFHEPTFGAKLGNMTSSAQICALLSAMMGYSARFYMSELQLNKNTGAEPAGDEELPGPDHFLGLAFRFIDEALDECGDDQPPLCILQALIVATHCQLTRGVHGRAWRSLGLCVRLAYELNLHLVDALETERAGPEDPIQWRDNEEKRRAWWAIWEMDVFASTIRRTPTAVDWAQMEILLPVDDSDWFQDRPAPSSFLESDPSQRWKSTQEAGNQSPKAWFLIINSIMKDAQLITSPHGVRWQSQQPQRNGSDGHLNSHRRSVNEARHKLEILANSVQCFAMALPQHLRYRSQYLGFDPPALVGSESNQQLHCGIYNIFVMTQLTRLMIHRYELFADNVSSRQIGRTGLPPASEETIGQLTSHLKDTNNASVRQYFGAADNIFMIVNRSSEDHIKHMNPFLLSTIWLASAVLLVRQHYGPPSKLPDLVKSRFDVLYLTYKRCIAFWNSKTAMGQNLEMLERRIEEDYRQQLANHQGQSIEEPRWLHTRRRNTSTSWVSEPFEGQGQDRRSSTTTQVTNSDRNGYFEAPSTGSEVQTREGAPVKRQNNRRVSFNRNKSKNGSRKLLDTPPPSVAEESAPSGSMNWRSTRARASPVTTAYFRSSQQQQQGQLQDNGRDNGPETDPISAVHIFSPISNESENPQMPSMDTEMPSFINNSPFMTMMNSQGAGNVELPRMDWRDFEMPMDLQDLLSGFSTY
ncbi:fungal-specific transcription factor domain-containing protein [Dactylonectria estremocensis]|uniref:Fungal-specific transcription factor domain-containing protein n=1 Tax=Dactylonectria estremocensis TaxID=1079267 RepID=A0A9P9E2H8_9HYPO|nr:fungal-specific transcription factor domain-containing protein [Dactylonectria estremocensis]